MTDMPATETLEERKARIAMLRRLNAVLPKEKRHPIPPLHGSATPQPADPAQPSVDDLLSMPRRAYAQLVCESLSSGKDNLWDLYLDPRLIQLTHSVLIRKHAAVVRLKNDPATQTGRRRRNFLDMLENRIQQVEEALPDAVWAPDRDTTRRLFAAIQAHRRALTTNNVAPEPWDLALWQTVDDLSDMQRTED
jgi:hypothetical protein